jgi:hypothetical protein
VHLSWPDQASGSGELVDGAFEAQVSVEDGTDGVLFVQVAGTVPVALPFTASDQGAFTASHGEIRGSVHPDATFVLRGLPAEPGRIELAYRAPGFGGRWWRASRALAPDDVVRGAVVELVLEPDPK